MTEIPAGTGPERVQLMEESDNPIIVAVPFVALEQYTPAHLSSHGSLAGIQQPHRPPCSGHGAAEQFVLAVTRDRRQFSGFNGIPGRGEIRHALAASRSA